jgi:hypothetical protein
MVVFQEFHKWRGVVCRTHGIPLAKQFLRRTLAQGWWGVISFFINWFDIAVDAEIWWRLSRFEAPNLAHTNENAAPNSSASS